MKPKCGGKVGLVVRPVRMGWAYSIFVTRPLEKRQVDREGNGRITVRPVLRKHECSEMEGTGSGFCPVVDCVNSSVDNSGKTFTLSAGSVINHQTKWAIA
jgi:hypothetical protein